MLAWTQPSYVAILLGNLGRCFGTRQGSWEVRRFVGPGSLKPDSPNSGDFVLNNPMTEGWLRTTHSWNTIFHNSAFWEARSPFPWSTAVGFFEVLAYGICIQDNQNKDLPVHFRVDFSMFNCGCVTPKVFFSRSIPIPIFPTISSWILAYSRIKSHPL